MINMCRICGKVIDRGVIAMTVICEYAQIPSVNKFKAKMSSIQFLSDTIAHVECAEQEEDNLLDE